jgi:hypothetical protein
MPHREADNSTEATSGKSGMPQPDTAASIEFLQRWRPTGVLTLVAILPDGKPSDVEGRSWITERPGAWIQIGRWIDQWQGKRNLYFTANEARLMDKKPAKTDMTRIWAYYSDADPDTSQGYAIGRARLMAERLSQFISGDLPASVVIDSGNGLQGLWQQAEGEPITAGGFEAFEAVNKPFSELMGSLGTFNVDRLLRIPGTINLPNKAKLKKGYPDTPSLARVLHHSDDRYTAEQIQAAVAERARAEAEAKRQQQQDHQQDHNLAGLPEALRTRFAAHLKSDAMLARRWRGDTTGLKDDTRSGVDMSLGAQLKQRGYSFNEMTAILRIFPHGAGAEQDDRYFDRIWNRAGQQQDKPGEADKPERDWSAAVAGLCLSVTNWLERDIPAPDFLMGEVFHTESRAYLIGPTGLGKTNFGMALSAAMAAGTDFLHWKGSGKPRRVLYVDGEMGQRLMIQRIQDVVRRHGANPAGLSILCRANAGEMPPLNTPDGKAFIEAVIEQLGGVDFIVFDNLQALVTGSLREEDAFAAVLTWAKILTGQSIGQIWVHHTGLDETRGYGDKSKEWQFDTVLLLKRVGEEGEVLFDLEFTKARERTPTNRADYARVQVALVDDAWKVEGARPGAQTRAPSPTGRKFHDALINALSMEQPPGTPKGRTTLTFWRSEAERMGLLEPNNGNRTHDNAEAATWSKYRKEILVAGWAGVNGQYVANLNTRK